MLIGIFIPALKTSAETPPKGKCTVSLADKTIESESTTTFEECKAKRVDGVKYSSWEQGSASTYTLLAPLPCPDNQDGSANPNCSKDGKLTTFDPAQPNNLSSYLNLMIRIFIGICAVLSMIMIVTGGLEYMTSELAHTKEAGKERIIQAILGLVIALGAYVLLFTINPDLLKGDPQIEDISVTATIKPAVQSAPLGTCEYYAGDNNTDLTVDITTEMACRRMGNFISWVKNP